jgi:beta-lactam-binding protein with PASTA domain
MGSTISLVLGSGVSNVNMSVPDLFGMTFSQAERRLDSMRIGLVPIADPDVEDTGNAYIYRQNPDRLNDDRKVNRIRPGQMIDVWLSTERPERIDTTTTIVDELTPQEQ